MLETLGDDNLDELIDRITRVGNASKFLAGFHPQPSWLWRQWHGTVLQQTWKPAIGMMLIAVAVVAYMEDSRTWPLMAVPDGAHMSVRRLKGLSEMWSYLLTMATFVNSFFLSQAYGYWLAAKGNARKVQGRLNDVSYLLATHARRDENGSYTEESRRLLENVARNLRLFHMLFWAWQVRPARGDEVMSIAVLRTERGINRLFERKQMTKKEHELLAGDSFRLRDSQRPSVVLEWIAARFVAAKQAGLLEGGAGMESTFLDKVLLLRSVCASIGDDPTARMPLAYVHLVQVLADSLIVLAPFALYTKLGVFTIPLVGILTTFYRGFLVLSKSFLDPYGNEDTLTENFSIHCLINESNAGSILWYTGIDKLPLDEEDMPRKK
jgi:predicted membrane chloride channel (bestrophin family)